MDKIFQDENSAKVDFLEIPTDVSSEASSFSMRKKQQEFLGGGIDRQQKEEKIDSPDSFPQSSSISKGQFDILAKRLLAHGGNIFTTRFEPGSEYQGDGKVDLDYHGGAIEVGITVSPELAKQLTEKQREKLHVGIDGGRIIYNEAGKPLEMNVGDTRIVNSQKEIGQQVPDAKHDHLPTHFINGEQPRLIRVREENVQRGSVDDVVKAIEDTQGEGLIFYTGAGISRSGERPIWNMNEMNKEMHLDNGALHFLSEFAEHPEELIGKFREFNQSFYEDTSTPAHIAIADIVKAKPGSIVFTENFDLRHEGEGSRIAATHFSSLQTHKDLMTRAKTAKTLVAVGLSHDDRAAIAVLKKANPDLKIFAFSLPPSDTIHLPNFLAENDPNDSVILGDCQKLLPEIAQQVKKFENDTREQGKTGQISGGNAY